MSLGLNRGQSAACGDPPVMRAVLIKQCPCSGCLGWLACRLRGCAQLRRARRARRRRRRRRPAPARRLPTAAMRLTSWRRCLPRTQTQSAPRRKCRRWAARRRGSSAQVSSALAASSHAAPSAAPDPKPNLMPCCARRCSTTLCAPTTMTCPLPKPSRHIDREGQECTVTLLTLAAPALQLPWRPQCAAGRCRDST